MSPYFWTEEEGDAVPTPFNRIVCSAPGVRAAFEGRGVWSVWWRLVLWLHGKPRDSRLTARAHAACVIELMYLITCGRHPA